MTCPHCNHSFPLTWRRYAKSPLGKHTCPACGRVSRFRWTVSYVTFVLIAWIVFLAVAFVVTLLIFPKTWQRMVGIPYYVSLYFVGCIVIIPLDRFFDERFRKLERPKDETIAA